MQQESFWLPILKFVRFIVFFATWYCAMDFVATALGYLQAHRQYEQLGTFVFLVLLCMTADVAARTEERRDLLKMVEGDEDMLGRKARQLDDPML